MRKIAPIVAIVAVMFALGFAGMQEAEEIPGTSLEARLAELEKWRGSAEQRLDELEKVTGLAGEEKPAETKGPADKATSLILVQLSKKRFQKADVSKGIWQEAIYWDATYDPVGLTKPARAVKGALEFADLFGEVQFRVRVTINEPLLPKKKLKKKGTGFEYNQFKDSHKWVRGTELKDMKIAFRMQSIIYQDGTTGSFE